MTEKSERTGRNIIFTYYYAATLTPHAADELRSLCGAVWRSWQHGESEGQGESLFFSGLIEGISKCAVIYSPPLANNAAYRLHAASSAKRKAEAAWAAWWRRREEDEEADAEETAESDGDVVD